MCQIISLENYSKVPYLNILRLFFQCFQCSTVFLRVYKWYVCVCKSAYISLCSYVCIFTYKCIYWLKKREGKLLLELAEKTSSELGKSKILQLKQPASAT